MIRDWFVFMGLKMLDRRKSNGTGGAMALERRRVNPKYAKLKLDESIERFEQTVHRALK